MCELDAPSTDNEQITCRLGQKYAQQPLDIVVEANGRNVTARESFVFIPQQCKVRQLPWRAKGGRFSHGPAEHAREARQAHNVEGRRN